MTEQALVTIMIPTYNQSGFIADAIRSALEQTYASVEVLVGDDASSDGTAQIVQRYVADPRVRYVRQERNLGRVAHYRCLLYEHARGEYVVNMDGDDYFTDPQFVSRAVADLEADPTTVCVAARTCWRHDGRDRVSGSPGDVRLPGLAVLARMSNPAYHFQHMATLYRRQLACRIGFYRTDTISSDWESLCRLALRGRVCFMDRIVGVWRQHADNATRTVKVEAIVEDIAVWRKVYEAAEHAGMPRWKALIACVRLEWVLLSSHCAVLSTNRVMAARELMKVYLQRNGWRATLGCLAPVSLLRVCWSLLGMRRQRSDC